MSVATKRSGYRSSTLVPVLTPLYGGHHESFSAQADGTYRCGSASECDFRLAFSGSEASHCSFIREAGIFSVSRLDGRVWVNDLPVHGKNRLTEGDVISFGPVSFQLELLEAPSASFEPANFFPPPVVTTPRPSVPHVTAPQAFRAELAEGMSTLAASTLRKELEEQQSLLRFRQQQLDEVAKIVRDRERQADSRVASLEARASQISAEWSELRQKKERLETLEQEFNLRANDVDRIREALEDQQRQVEVTAQQNAVSLATIEQAQLVLSQLEPELRERDRALHARANSLAEQEATIAHRAKALADAEREFVTQADSRNAAQLAVIAAQQETAARERQSAIEAHNQLSQLQKTIEARHLELERRQLEMDSREDEVSSRLLTLKTYRSQLRDTQAVAVESTPSSASPDLLLKRVALEQEQAALHAEREALDRRAADVLAKEARISLLLSDADSKLQAAESERIALHGAQKDLLCERNSLSQLRQDLASRESGIAEREVLAARKLEDMRSRFNALEVRAAQLKQQESEIDCRSAEVHRRVQQLKTDLLAQHESTSEVSVIRQQVEEMQQALAATESHRDALLSERDALLSERDSLLSERDSMLSERDSMLSERDSMLAERDSMLAERDSLLAERDSLLAERDALLSKRDSMLAERDTMLAERDSMLSERDSMLAERDSLLSERDSMLVERDSLLAERDSLLAEGDSMLAERDALLSERDSMLSERDALLSERDALLSERDAMLSERDSMLSERDALLAEPDSMLSAVKELQTALQNARQDVEDANRVKDESAKQKERLKKAYLDLDERGKCLQLHESNLLQAHEELETLRTELAEMVRERDELTAKLADRSVTAEDSSSLPPLVDSNAAETFAQQSRELDQRAELLDQREQELRERNRKIVQSESEVEAQRRQLLEARQQLELARAEIQLAMRRQTESATNVGTSMDRLSEYAVPNDDLSDPLEDRHDVPSNDIDHDDDLKPATDLRSELAGLFGLRKPAIENRTLDTVPRSEFMDLSEPAGENRAVALHFGAPDARLTPTKSESAATPDAGAEPARAENSDDFVRDYMEQLLSRNRKSAGGVLPGELKPAAKNSDAVAASAAKTSPDKPVTKSPPKVKSFIEQYMAGNIGDLDSGHALTMSDDDNPFDSEPAAEVRPVQPRQKIDLMKLKENMESFRTLSTQSVENALASHAIKQERLGFRGRAALACVLFVLSLILWIANDQGAIDSPMLTWVTLTSAIAIVSELYRRYSVIKIHARSPLDLFSKPEKLKGGNRKPANQLPTVPDISPAPNDDVQSSSMEVAATESRTDDSAEVLSPLSLS